MNGAHAEYDEGDYGESGEDDKKKMSSRRRRRRFAMMKKMMAFAINM